MNKLYQLILLLLMVTITGHSFFAVAAKLPVTDDSAISLLLEQLSHWQGQNNRYQETLILNKLANINDVHPVYLEAKVIAFVKEGEFQSADNLLFKYQQTSVTAEEVNRLTSLFNIFKDHRALLGEARLAARGNKYEKALIHYQQLFADSPIHRELALEYWDVLTEVQPDTERQVLQRLAELSQQYPSNLRFELAYLKYQLRTKNNIEMLAPKLEALQGDPVWGNEVKRLWQSALENTPVTWQSLKLFEQYLTYFPTDNFIKLPFDEGVKALNKQQRLRRLPEYQAKLKALALLDSAGDLTQIKRQLNIALLGFPNDAELHAASAIASLREGLHQQSITALNKCIALADSNVSQCRSLMNTAKYWQGIAKVNAFYDQHQLARGKKIVDTLYQYPNEGVAHIVLDAQFYSLKNQYAAAVKLYQKALVFESENASAWQGLFDLKLKSIGATRTKNWYSKLSPSTQSLLAARITTLDVASLKQQAAKLFDNGNSKAAQAKLQQALMLTPDDVWIKYDLAKSYLATNDVRQFNALYQPPPSTAEAKYAYALLLASQEYYPQAISQIESTQPKARTEAMLQSLQRFYFEKSLVEVNQQQDIEKRLNLLTQMQQRYQQNAEYLGTLADMYTRFGYYSHAITTLEHLLALTPANRCFYQLTLVSIYQQQQQFEQAERLLAQLLISPELTPAQELRVVQASIEQLSLYQQTRIDAYALKQPLTALQAQPTLLQPSLETSVTLAAYLGEVDEQWLGYQSLINGDPDQQHYKQQLLALSLTLTPADFDQDKNNYLAQLTDSYMDDHPFDPIGYEVASVFAEQAGTTNAQHYLLLAFQSALLKQKSTPLGINTEQYSNATALNESITTSLSKADNTTELADLTELIAAITEQKTVASIDQSFDHWYVNRQRGRLLRENQQQNGNVELAYNDYSDGGRAGTSEYQLQVLSLALNLPFNQEVLGQGTWSIRLEPTSIYAGKLDVSETSDFGSLRLCGLDCPLSDNVQEDNGVAVAVAIDTQDWRADIGTTPMGFAHSEVVGGVEVDGAFASVDWSLSAAIRPLSASLLSYSGSKDPYSGLTWGTARIYSLGGSLSYDLGQGFGAWSVADHSLISGLQIKDNYRTRIMGGGYYSVMDEEWLTTDIGINLFYWQYQENLSHYTLGQSGYYSPQSYQAFSLPVSFYGRQNRFSYQLDLSVSWSKTDTDDSDYYPLHSQYQQQLEQFSDDSFKGGKSNGDGYYAKAAVEYKLSSHWLLGAAATIQQSDFYSPNSFMLYLKYYFSDDYAPVPKPPKFITPYKDF